jgi:hypothetical protein
MKPPLSALLLGATLLLVEADPLPGMRRGNFPGQPDGNYEGCGKEFTARKRIKGGKNITVSIRIRFQYILITSI